MEIDMPRTDIHRPAAIVPADYHFVAVRYDGPSASTLMSLAESRKALRDHMDRTGGKYSQHEHGGSCHVCGAGALYLAIYHHPKTNTYICVGEDCADKIDMYDVDAFAPVRRAVKDAKEYAAGKAKAEQLLTERGLQAALTIDHDIIKDLVRKLQQYGDLSDKQWTFLTKLVEEAPLRAAREEQRKAVDAASQHVGTIGDRRDFILTVAFVTGFNTAFGFMNVIGMRDEQGNLYIYKGSAMIYNAERKDAAKGDTLTFKATIKEHGEREGVKQTILSRPAQKL
jgi:hypothetical protein